MDTDGHLSDCSSHSQACDVELVPDATSLDLVPHSTASNGRQIDQSGCMETCMEQQNEASTSGSSVSETCTSSKPNFSILQGEICLDDFSVRELQEAFRATFGRQTSVKDKLWLKRRIAMGLTNSCDVSDNRFVIKENKKFQNNMEEAACREHKIDSETHPLPTNQVAALINDCYGGSPSGLANQLEGQQVLSGKRLLKLVIETDKNPEDLHVEWGTTKRVRKPTKRYIEELSEIETRESTGRLPAAVKSSRHDSQKSLIRPVCDNGSRGITLCSRQDFLGGSGVQIPYVRRVRRRRRRRDFMAIWNFIDTGIGESGIETSNSEENQDHEHEKIPKAGDNSDDNVNALLSSENGTMSIGLCEDDPEDNDNAVPKLIGGGAKRKHHRAWTLCEVLKLVDGVARYGAGRWSEIRRLAFASYSYRTSVDLKDKWRNLLRASFTQWPPQKQPGNLRKHSSIPIPAPILLRVRELAEMHSQTGLEMKPSKIPGHGEKIVQEDGSGFL